MNSSVTAFNTKHVHTGRSPLKAIILAGLSLFAIFFGAGNVVFPLLIGARAGEYLGEATAGFILMGVGMPFLGVIATSLYQGDYWRFFMQLGKVPAAVLATACMVAIGPLIAMPRTAMVSFESLSPFFQAQGLNIDLPLFSAIYCGIVFMLSVKESNALDILGYFLSPIKIFSFLSLIFIALWKTHTPGHTLYTGPSQAFSSAAMAGYNTMDLLGAFFFCTLITRMIAKQTTGNIDARPPLSSLVASAVVGGLALGIVYLGFMGAAYFHTDALTPILTGTASKARSIALLAEAVLGPWGGLFVGGMVAFACLATCMALAQICTQFFYSTVARKKIPAPWWLTLVMGLTYAISNIGFEALLGLAEPLLSVLYPTLIALCVMNTLHYYLPKQFSSVKLPVFLVAVLSGWTVFA